MSGTIQRPDDQKELLVNMRDEIDRTAITPLVQAFYAHLYSETKEKIDKMAAEMHQGRDKIRFLTDLISDINNLTDKKGHGVDLTSQSEIQEKMRVAKGLGVRINPDQLEFDSEERRLLIENLNLKAEEWDTDIRTQIQMLEKHENHLKLIILVMNDFRKCEDRSKRASTSAIKGG